MKTITTHDAKTHLSRYLSEVEDGKQFLITRGKTVVAMLMPVLSENLRSRPKVGEIDGEPFEFPSEALAPLTNVEVDEWGL